MTNFLDILLEAKGTKPIAVKPPTPNAKETTDYTKEAETEETTDDTTEEETETEEAGSEPTDYTEEDAEIAPDEESGDETESQPTDYTEEDTETDTDDGADTGDDSTDGTSDEMTETDSGEDSEQEQDEKENNRILMDDYINLYNTIKSTVGKIESIDKSNIAINMITDQINNNLNVLTKQLFEYIIFIFEKTKYVTNLYKYNYFLEAFKINVQMLKKISVFVSN